MDGGALKLAAGCSAVRVAVSAPHARPPDHVPLLGPQEVGQDHGHITLLTGMIRVNGGPVPDVVREALHTGVTLFMQHLIKHEYYFLCDCDGWK